MLGWWITVSSLPAGVKDLTPQEVQPEHVLATLGGRPA